MKPVRNFDEISGKPGEAILKGDAQGASNVLIFSGEEHGDGTTGRTEWTFGRHSQ